MEPMRLVYWNIPELWKMAFYVIAGTTFLAFILGLWARLSLWSRGRDEDNILRGRGPLGLLWLSFRTFFSLDCLLYRKLFARSAFRGAMLILIIWSFVILFIGTVLVTLEHYFNLNFFLVGRVYLAFSLILDIAGALLMVGLTAALIRRYTTPLERRITTPEDVLFIVLLLGVVILGFTAEGLRLAILTPPAQDWSPVGGAFAALFTGLLPPEVLPRAHAAAWLAHGVIAMIFVAYIPYSRIIHLFAAQITASLSSSRYGGVVYED